jgi:hypothetical protein
MEPDGSLLCSRGGMGCAVHGHVGMCVCVCASGAGTVWGSNQPWADNCTYIQEPAKGPYAESDESSPHPPTLFP